LDPPGQYNATPFGVLGDNDNFRFASIDDAIHDLRPGMIVVVDDEDRENEGDLTMAAEMITPEAINSWPHRTRLDLPGDVG